MTLVRYLRTGLAAVCFAGLVSVAIAQETGVSAHPSIPFKTEPTPLQSHGENLGIGMLVLLIGAGGVLYFVRRRLPQMQLGAKLGGSKRIRIVEQARLNPRCSLYLVSVDQREILVGVSGDNLTVLDASAMAQGKQGEAGV